MLSRLSWIKNDGVLIGTALAVLAVSAYLLLRPTLWEESEEGSAPVIGQIRLQKNDTRLRLGDSMTWRATDRSKRNVRIGDALFAGDKSYIQVNLKRGSDITIGENSMIVFREFKGQALANLENGNFRISVNGTVSVAVSGEIVTLEGQKSDVQIVYDHDQKPKIKLLAGQVQVRKSEGKAISLALGETMSLQNHEPSKENPRSVTTPITENQASTTTYFWRMSDLYNKDSSGKISPHPAPQMVQTTNELAWQNPQHRSPTTIEIASDSEFTKPFRVTSAESRAANVPLFPGKNYWRVSFDNKTWSPPNLITVQCRFRPDLNVEASVENEELILKRNIAIARFHLKASEPALGFIAEHAQTSDFSGNTRLIWFKKMDIRMGLDQIGHHFLRFRMVAPNNELSEWSNSIHVQVQSPAPILAERDYSTSRKTSKEDRRQTASVEEKESSLPQEAPVQSSRAKVLKKEPKEYPLRQNHWIWAGSGLQYSTFQESADNGIQVSYSSTTFLSLSILGKYQFSDRWALLGSLRNTPGYANSSESISTQDGKYNWSTFAVEGLFSPRTWNFQLLNRSVQLALRFGLQHHSMPFLVKQSTTEVSIENSPVTMATVGAQFDWSLSKSTQFETHLRYQYPLASSPQASVSPGTTFDGSVGIMKMISPVFAIGGFWYGQYQNFPYTRNEASSTVNATQQIFFSSVEGRIGYIFP